MTDPILSIEQLDIAFRADGGLVHAVKGVSFQIPRGRTVALVGESGSGKTVISQAIMGILPKNAVVQGGALHFCDGEPGTTVDLLALPDASPERRAYRGGKVSIIFQEPMSSLSPMHTIGDQIGEALMLHNDIGSEDVQARVEAMLDKVGFPDPARAFRMYPFELSGGLRQRAMIAMALICGPSLLIADEPTTALDVTVQAQILGLIKDLQAEFGMAVLFITHDLGVVANIADDVVVMFRGDIMESGPAADLINDPQHPYLKALLHAVPRLHTDKSERLTPLRSIDTDAKTLLGREMSSSSQEAMGEPLLRVENLRKSFTTRSGSFWGFGETTRVDAVRDVSFTIHRGESFALVGESGCGKTTVSKLLMRATDADDGRIVWHGHEGDMDIRGLSEQELVTFRKKLQYMFQDPFGSLNPRMTVRDLITEPLKIHGMTDASDAKDMAERLLKAVGLLPQYLNRYPHSFSGGQRQRIGIARALALGPELLICDEPVSALDVSVQAQILNLLKDLQSQLGLTYMFISHNLAVVRYIADRIAVMCRGRIVEMADTEALFENPQHPYTKNLLSAVPEPDLAYPLDFNALAQSTESDPALWPGHFCDQDGNAKLVEVAPAHWIRKQRAA